MIKVLYTGDYDANGRPVRAIGPADRQIMDVDPDFQGGFNTRVAYKGFDLGIVGIYRSGGILFSTIHGSNGYLNLLTGRRNNINVDYWTPTNTGAKYPNPAGPISNDNPRYASTLSYFDGSFMKIRTITLGYDLSRSLIKIPILICGCILPHKTRLLCSRHSIRNRVWIRKQIRSEMKMRQ